MKVCACCFFCPVLFFSLVYLFVCLFVCLLLNDFVYSTSNQDLSLSIMCKGDC